MNENINQKESSHELENKYLTQEEVALRFRVSQSTIKNWRDKGLLEYLQPTGSTRVLYPRETVEEFEKLHRQRAKVIEFKRPEPVRREKTGLSSNRIKKHWRI
jgi:excisionase family DNA binding protein